MASQRVFLDFFFRLVSLRTRAQASKSGSGKVNFNEFVTMMASRMKEMDSERTVLEAFECFDTGKKKAPQSPPRHITYSSPLVVGTGTFSIQDFTDILCKAGTGPHLTEREVKELIKEVGTNSDNQVDYRRLVKLMYARK